MAFHYEDVKAGDVFYSPTRTITESDVLQFAGLTGDFNELHTSRTFAEKTKFGHPIAHGMLTLSMANGLYMRSNIFPSTIFLGIENLKFHAPVFLGDTIQLKLTIENRHLTSDGKKCIYSMKYDVFNQSEALVLEGLFTRMLVL